MNGKTVDHVLHRCHSYERIQIFQNGIEITHALLFVDGQVFALDKPQITLLHIWIGEFFHQTLALTLDGGIIDTAGFTRIAKVFVTTQIKLFEQTMDSLTGLFLNHKALLFGHIHENLSELIGVVVIKVD